MDFERLPNFAKPVRYAIVLSPSFDTFTFDGEASIEIKVERPENYLKLNICGLTIHNLTLNNDGGEEVKLLKYNIYEKEEILHILTENPLTIGTYFLNVKYVGSLNESLRGFYRIQTNNEDDKEFSAATYFTPTEARRCFPCWDEPAYKAIFDVVIKTTSDFEVLSNMPIKSLSKENEERKFVFESSPIMSTYLLAVVIGRYEYVESKTEKGVVIRAYAWKNKVEQVQFALEVAVKCLDYYCEFFGIDFPLPKLDLIALPELEVGAMEHWGLITFREALLLVDENNTSSAVKERVAITVAHEIAHQWFGNLVTMEWWTHIWLNEGYASFMEYLAIDHLYPEFNVWTSFMTGTYQLALELDSLSNSHPIEVKVGHPSEVNEIFDIISYKKGCSIIRMLYLYLQDCNFRKGMRLYMSRHQYKNTETNDLWAALEEASNKPVQKIMSSWTLQTGYPVVIVETIEEENGVRVKLRQERFFLNKNLRKQDTSLWSIPITIQVENNESYDLILDKENDELFIPYITKKMWIKLNYQSYGFFRVLYPDYMYDNLAYAVKNKLLSVSDRLGLIADLFQLARSGYTNTVHALRFLKAYEREDNPSIWRMIINNLNHVKLILRGRSCENQFNKFVCELLLDVYTKLGWDCSENEEHTFKKLRPLVLSEFIANGHDKAIFMATKLFLQHVTSGTSLHPDIRLPVYEGAVQSVPTAVDFLYEKFGSTDSIEEKYDIIISLSSSKDIKLLTKLLRFIMADCVRLQDRLAFMRLVVASSKDGGKIIWQYFKTNYVQFKECYENTFMIRDFISSFKKSFTSKAEADELEEFFKENPIGGTERAINQTLEMIRVSANWYERDFTALEQYFTE